MPLRGLQLNQIRVQVSSRLMVITSGARFRFSTHDNNPISKINNEKSSLGRSTDTVYGALPFPTCP
eukprot:3879706-Pleurochrysis_carterae.AAC.1